MRKLLLASLLLVSWTAIAASPPNVLLIVSDDQGYPDLGCMGIKPVQTPNLDRLAREGVRATSFYVTWPACTPSRSSILTGRYPQRNGLYDMVRNDMVNYGHRFTAEEYAVSPEMTLGLDVREKTLGDLLKSAGYRCGMVGKWDMGQAKRFLPLQRGFDFFYGHGNNGIDYYTHERYGVPSLFRGNQRTQEDKGTYVTEVFEREALNFVSDTKGRPWFLYLCFNAPHGASTFASEPGEPKTAEGVQVPEKYAAMYQSKLKGDQGKAEKLARYYGAVTRMDEAIGRLLALIDRRGETQDTLVLFMSDNGGSGNGDNKPLKGHKSQMWEGGLRVPFLARWPGHIPAGTVTNEFLTGLELLPTLAKASGTSTEVKLDGFDMLPVLAGKAKSSRTEMFWQRRSDKAARAGDWKWVQSSAGEGLYNLADDLGETQDLSKAEPDTLARVKARFQAWSAEMEAAEPRGPFRDY